MFVRLTLDTGCTSIKIPISKLSLEGCLEFLAQDELLEVTPENLRIRKQILNHEQRMKAKSRMK